MDQNNQTEHITNSEKSTPVAEKVQMPHHWM